MIRGRINDLEKRLMNIDTPFQVWRGYSHTNIILERKPVDPCIKDIR